MAANQPSWPRRWLMTDERIGDRLWEAIDRIPSGDGGIVFRHYRLSGLERAGLGIRLAAAARDRGLVLAVAGSCQLAEELGAALVHNPDRSSDLPFSQAVHDEAQADRARRLPAALAFVGPVHPTRSHPGALSLGSIQAAKLAQAAACPAIAVGGMDEGRFAHLVSGHPGAFHGYAGIDCWLK
ncbi:MAG TPA: thiamine phosphate synthase [Sphingomicrobium sp.]|nr:thiamine phosphate synthase [Sphingomicrobium sp.]